MQIDTSKLSEEDRVKYSELNILTNYACSTLNVFWDIVEKAKRGQEIKLVVDKDGVREDRGLKEVKDDIKNTP
jgi:hypothetical protein